MAPNVYGSIANTVIDALGHRMAQGVPELPRLPDTRPPAGLVAYAHEQSPMAGWALENASLHNLAQFLPGYEWATDKDSRSVANTALEGMGGIGDGLQAANKAIPGLMGMAGMTAWHGSPHRFDRFQMDKIGTGEGAQAYGHGLYFAESPDVAGGYKKVLSQAHPDDAYKEILAVSNANGTGLSAQESSWLETVIHHDKTPAEIRGEFYDYFPEWKTVEDNGESAAAIEKLVSDVRERLPQGHLYEVDIPDEAIGQMLDWDKPLSEQPESVLNSLRSHVESRVAEAAGNIYLTDEATQSINEMLKYPDDVKGWEVYQDLSDRFYDGAKREGLDAKHAARGVSQESASNLLNELGIPGIRYLDGNSRNAGEGTSNFVLFDENMAEVKSRNGEKVAPALQLQRDAQKFLNSK